MIMTEPTKAPRKAARPTIKERAAQPICPNCGGTPVRKSVKGPFPTYCSIACKTEHRNRFSSRGASLVGWAQAWRIDRGSGEIAKGAFEQLCQILDAFNSADATAGRPRADLYAAKLLAGGTLFIDRRH